MRECADRFSERTGITVKVTVGTPPQWIEKARQDGDLIFEGAEYMLNDFVKAYPELVDESSITGLYARPVAILVRQGNPEGIRDLHDLTGNAMKIMVVTQENMDEVYNHVPRIQYNVVMPVLTGKQAERTWKAMSELDVWITYESWRQALNDEADIVKVRGRERCLRLTPVAIMRTSKNRKRIEEFVAFLKSQEAHTLFQKWGWR